MKSRILLLGLGALVIWAMPVMAFHDAGVAHCDGCHTMHNSIDGEPVATQADGETLWPVGQGNDFLLEFASATDLCLSCHGDGNTGRRVWDWGNENCATAPPDERGAGEFDCQTAANISDSSRGGPVPGHKSGHTLISALAGRLTPDDDLTMSPGGTYPSDQLRCTSCHDPHGSSNFRLLYGKGQITPLVGEWSNDLNAIGISTSTREAPESDSHHNVYRWGYSGWCKSCHELMHNNGQNIHPSGEIIGADERGIYNGYIGSADCVEGPCPSAGPGVDETDGAYLAQVPFEDNTRFNTEDIRGPGPSSVVSCVSCHRAHGTSAENAGRWDFKVTALEEDGVLAYALPNPYGAGQRSLCNKCHAKDAYDATWEE